MPGDAFSQLHNLASYMLFNGVSASLKSTSESKHSDFVVLILRPARGLTDTGAQLLNDGVTDIASDMEWCPVDVTPPNMTATCGGIGSAKVVQVMDFRAGIVGVSGVMRFLVLEEPVSTDGRQQFIPPLTPVTLMRQLGVNIRMKESGDVLEIEDDRWTTQAEALARQRSGHVHNELDFFSKDGWTLPASLRPQLKYDPVHRAQPP